MLIVQAGMVLLCRVPAQALEKYVLSLSPLSLLFSLSLLLCVCVCVCVCMCGVVCVCPRLAHARTYAHAHAHTLSSTVLRSFIINYAHDIASTTHRHIIDSNSLGIPPRRTRLTLTPRSIHHATCTVAGGHKEICKATVARQSKAAATAVPGDTSGGSAPGPAHTAANTVSPQSVRTPAPPPAAGAATAQAIHALLEKGQKHAQASEFAEAVVMYRDAREKSIASFGVDSPVRNVHLVQGLHMWRCREVEPHSAVCINNI
jgi:hypothetical protein